jgi:hypothetical protein
MSRIRRLATLILPSVIAGGLVFGTAFGQTSGEDDDAQGASDGGDEDAARRAPARRTADGHRVPPLPPAPPPPGTPVPPAPPVPPVPPGGWGQPPPGTPVRGGGGRFSVTIRDGKVHIDGLEGFTRQHLDHVREMIRNHPGIPQDVRDRALARLDRARAVLERRLRNLNVADLDQLGDEMEKMGEELEKAMEGLEEEMDKLGEKLGKDFAKQLGKDLAKGLRPRLRIDRDRDRDRDHDHGDDHDDDDDHDRVAVAPDDDSDADTRGAIRDLSDLTLRPAQRDQIVKLRASYEQQIAVARKQLDDASRRLEVALADPKASDADISRYIDQVSAHEASIRKARLLTWVNARRLLDDAQRKQVEDASRKRTR